MTVQTFREMLGRRPFQPVKLTLSSGQSYEIRHPEMLNGWGGYFLTTANHVNAFFSHDEFVDFYAEREGSLEQVRETLGRAK